MKLFTKDFINYISVWFLFVGLAVCPACGYQEMVLKETENLLAVNHKTIPKIINEADTEQLPEPVRAWLKASGMTGKAAIQQGWVRQKARMKMKPDATEWVQAAATQYTTTEPPAFLWTVVMEMGPGLTIRGRDKFVGGKGEMLIRLNYLITIVDATGEKINEGSLQRFLGEMVWFPSLALSPYIRWEPIDRLSARATMNYLGTSGSGTFYFNEKGDFVKFSALRYKGNDLDSRRYLWEITAVDYATFSGVRVPSRMKATWILDEGDWTWLELEIEELRFNKNIPK